MPILATPLSCLLTLSISLPLSEPKSLPLRKRSWTRNLECVCDALQTLTKAMAVPEAVVPASLGKRRGPCPLQTGLFKGP